MKKKVSVKVVKEKPKVKSYKVKEALFFKEDFDNMPKHTMLYVKEGKIMVIKK